jgi:cytochrome c-type biogenesis protein CcmE
MSKKLDEELAAAVLAGDAQRPLGASAAEDAPSVVKPLRPEGAPAPRRPKNLGLLFTLLAMVGAIVALFLGVFQPAAVYATAVDKLVNEPGAYTGRKVRVEGELVPGTLVKRDSPCEYRFSVHKDSARLPVRYAQCVIPDGFRDVPQGGVQVTVEGALTKGGDFEATLVMAKCSSKYDPAKHEMAGDSPKGSLPVN